MEQRGSPTSFPATLRGGEAERGHPAPGMLCPGDALPRVRGGCAPQRDFTQPFAGCFPAPSPAVGLFLSRNPKQFGESRAEDGGRGSPQPLGSAKGFAQRREAGTGHGVPTVTGGSGGRAPGLALAPFSAVGK